MFSGATSFNQRLNGWDVENVENTSQMFSGATSFNKSLKWQVTSNLTDISGMFEGATSFNKPLKWNVGNVTTMAYTFRGATSFNQLLDWNVQNVTNMVYMFGDATSFDRYLEWNTAKVENMSGMFQGATSFNQNLSHWDVSSVTNMESMFENAESFNQDLSLWTATDVTNVNHMFYGASAFKGRLPKFRNAINFRGWLHGTEKKNIRDRAINQFCREEPSGVCSRCYTVYEKIDNIGRWNCSFHPGTYDESEGYSCCKRRYRRVRTNVYQQSGFENVRCGYHTKINGKTIYVENPPPPPGCTKCDHGLDLKPIVLNDFISVAEFIDADSVRRCVADDDGVITIYRYDNVS